MMASSSTLEQISARLRAGERLTSEEVAALTSTSDILSLGMLADEARRRRHGDRVTYVRVTHVTLQDVAEGRWPTGEAGELRIAGIPRSIDEAVLAVRSVIDRANDIPVTAFRLEDFGSVADGERVPLDVCLTRLRDAGLEWIAEATLDSPRFERSLEAAIKVGLKIPRVILEEAGDGWVDRIALLVRIQQTHGLVRALTPLPRLVSAAVPTTGYEDVRRVAIARLIADNVETIQVDWPLYGPKLAQVSLMFGADDLDGVPAADAQSLGPRRTVHSEVRRNIQAAAMVPIERNGRWEPIG
jgi:aminodeoxyfutalosine synthase